MTHILITYLPFHFRQFAVVHLSSEELASTLRELQVRDRRTQIIMRMLQKLLSQQPSSMTIMDKTIARKKIWLLLSKTMDTAPA